MRCAMARMVFFHFDDTCTNFCINPRTSLCVSLGRCFDSLVVYRRAEKSMKAYKASAWLKAVASFVNMAPDNFCYKPSHILISLISYLMSLGDTRQRYNIPGCCCYR